MNQHGKQMFRVGNRHLDPPAAKVPDAPVSPPRRSRISIFTPKSLIQPNDRPQTASSASSGHRKLRKTRSFGPGDQDQQEPQPAGRAHSHSVTSADVSRFLTPFVHPPTIPSPVPQGDVFAQVMQWRAPYANPSTVSFSTMATTGTTVNSTGYEKSLASTGSSGRGQPDRPFVQHPFGPGVAFDSPVRKPPRVKRNDSQGSVITRDPRPVSQDSVLTQVPAASASVDVDPDAALAESHYPPRLAMPPSKMLREMQSFESTMTARQVDIEPETARGTPTASISASPWDMIDYRLLNSYDDNPNLKRPPSAVWLRSLALAAPATNGGQLGELKLPETPEPDTTLASDTAPSTPVLTPAASVADDDEEEATTIPVDEAVRAFMTTHDDDNDNDGMPMIPDESESEAGPSSLRYTSTPDVFDVLQTYSGLPLLDRLPAMSAKRASGVGVVGVAGGGGGGDGGGGGRVGERGAKVVEGGQDDGDDGDDDDDDDDLMVEMTVIRMSLTTKEESAAPRDDPRFVIWGWVNDVAPEKKEVKVEKKTRSWRGSLLSGSEGEKSLSDHESHSKKSRLSLGSRSRSRKEKGRPPAVSEFGVVEDTLDASEDDPTRVPSTSEGKKKVLIAATIERWVAQLTSEMDYDELLVFFLTYRTYVSATDLCRVLIGRFYWALRGGEENGDTKVCDDRVRRIVRVRTFVAIRYWLIQFWPVDFVPNRELRLLMADCLNQLNRDPLLKKHVDGLVGCRSAPAVMSLLTLERF